MLSKKNQRRQKSGKKALRHVGVSLAVAGILGISPYAVPQLYAASLGGSDVLNVGTGSVDENKAYNENLSLDGGTVNFGSNQDKAGTVTSTGNVVMNGGTITVSGSGDKVSGAILMGGEANKNNPHTPQVVPGSTNTFIPDPDPALKPPVHSVTAAQGMTINNVSVNIGAPTYGAGGPAQSDIDKSWEGLRLDLKTSGGDMAIKGGDFRVANIAFPIKQEANAALRFESAGSITVSDGQFTAQGQPVPNPARSNYDAPSLISFKATNDLVIDGGTFDIQTARVHMTSTEGKVVFNDGTFNINSKSPYPGWKTFEKGTGGQPNTIDTEGESTQTAQNVFGSLDTSGSVVEINGGTFNLGTPGETTANYFNLADKSATFNGGTFNIYTNSNFGNNKADLIIKGGEYNLIDGGYFGGRNYSGAALDIQGGTFNFDGGQGLFGYSIGVITEAAQLNNDKYNKASIDISGGTFNYTSKNSTKQEVATTYVGYELNISGGEFIRKDDGANSITAAFVVTGQEGSAADSSGNMNISGGLFKTDNPVLSFTENPKVETKRDVALKLKAPSVEGVPDSFIDPTNMSQDYKDAVAAGKASYLAQSQLGFDFKAAKHIAVTGGTFEFNGANMKRFTADTASFSGATMNMSEGYTEINAPNGIFFKDGTYNLKGTKEYAQYDLGRDRWVLGSRLTLSSDKAIVFGELGKTGPTFTVNDSLLMALPGVGDKTGDFVFNSGTYTFTGDFRSTLLQSGSNMFINGGDFKVVTSDALYAEVLKKTEAKSMITMDSVHMSGGSVSLYNSDLNGLDAVNISGGVLRAEGVSVVNSNGAYGDKNVAGRGSMNISGGDFIREKDGVGGTQLTFNTNNDLNISGGTFKTKEPANYIRENNIVISRDDNIRLYNKADPISAPDKTYNLHTEDSVKAIFATGNAAAIKEAFAPLHNPDYLPTETEVLTALKVANNMTASNALTGWAFKASDNINISGGTFNLTTVNSSSFTAGGFFNFANATLLSSGGGGALTISGTKGINIASGVIKSYGGDENGPFALQYDNRNRLDRDRWTLGKYLNFKTDGDIVIGTKGSAFGPEIYYQDGMIGFGTVTQGAPLGKLYLYSGSLTLHGEYRSTLNGGVMADTIIDGGTLNISTNDNINRNELDSASMWTLPVNLQSGTINLYNAQLGGPQVIMDGGVINATGDSSINSSSTGKVALNAGTVNLGHKAYIGAIKGDSLALSPYVTGTKDIVLGDGLNVNMAVNKPASGTALTVGQDIGGIFASSNNKGVPTIDPTSIVIADGTSFNISNPTVLAPGDYTAVNFIEAQNGVLTMSNKNTDSLFYSMNINKNSDNKSADLSLNVKNPVSVIGNLPGSDNVRDNALGFAELLRNAKGNWASVASNVAHASAAEAAETLRQIGGENTTATAQSLVTSVGEFRGRMQAQGKANISGLASGDSVYSKEYRAWISGMGSWGNQASSGGRTGFDSSSAGVAMGFDRTFADRYLLGLGLGYAKGYAESKDGLSDTNSDTWFVSLYTSLDFDPVVIDADVTYANTQSQIKSNIVSGGQNYENNGDFGVDSWSASIKGSYIFRFNDNATKIAPYVGIDFLSIQQHGYTEDGPLARSFGSDFSTLWTLPVGVKASHEFRGQNWTFTPEVGVGYARDLNEFKPAARVTVPGITNTEIKTYGSKLAPDSFRGNAGFSLKCNDSVEFYGMYNLDARDKFTNHSVNVGFSYSF